MTNVLPASSGVFMRAACPHARLFRTEYKRSNRNRGTKILRCFPHCCPSHEDRSYCGSSLEVVLRFDLQSGVFGSFDFGKVHVFAHFETVNESEPVTSFNLRYLRSISQSEANPEGTWVEGVRQTTVGGSQHSQSLHGLHRTTANSDSPDSTTFVLKGQTFTKWYYNWGSGANKVHRSTQHVLRAYAFYQADEAQGQETSSLRLLCVVTSPPFTVVSYRRAPLSAQMFGPETAVATLPLTNQSVEVKLQHFQHQISREFYEYNRHQPLHEANDCSDGIALPVTHSQMEEEEDSIINERELCAQYRHSQELEGVRFRLVTPQIASYLPSSPPNQVQSRIVFDRTRYSYENQQWRDTNYDDAVPQPRLLRRRTEAWPYETKAATPAVAKPITTDFFRRVDQIANDNPPFKYHLQLQNHPRELQQLTDLATIHFIASHITICDSKNLEIVLMVAIDQHWRHSGGAAHLATLLQTVACQGAAEVTGAASGDDYPNMAIRKREELLLVLGEVCVWMFSPENFGLMRSWLAACYPLLLYTSGSGDSNVNLCPLYLECVGRCWDALEAFLESPRASDSEVRNVRGLSDAILGVVYSDPNFKDLRSGLRAVLQRPGVVVDDSDGCNDSLRCNLLGWRCFVAQAQEGYLRNEDPPRGSVEQKIRTQPSRWTADWLIRPGRLSVISPGQGTGSAWEGIPSNMLPSMWTSCFALSQLLHLRFEAVGDPLHTFHLHAEPSIIPGGVKLICDGRVHVASVVPNGMTSLTVGSVDYVAYEQNIMSVSSRKPYACGSRRAPAENAYGNIPVRLEFFWWPLQGRTQDYVKIGFRSVFTLRLSTSNALMEVDVNWEHGSVAREMIEAAQTPWMELWTPSERVQAVSDWHPWFSIYGVYSRK